MIAIGLLHQTVGTAMGLGLLAAPDGTHGRPLVELFRAGLVGQADSDLLRLSMVWFLLFGFMMIFAGAALRHARPTRALALGFAGLCALGVLLMPASGFWLGFIPAVQLWRQSPGDAAVA